MVNVMKIKMLMSISGVGFSLARGDETERFPEKDALNLIKRGVAVLASGASPEINVTVNQDTETAIAALNGGAAGHNGSEGGQGSVGSAETGTENTGAVGEAGNQDGQEPAATGDAANTANENGTGTDNASADGTGSGGQSDAAQAASGKGKGKAS